MRTLLTLLVCAALHAQIPATDASNTDIPNTDTHFTARPYKTLAEWQARRAHLRKQILSAAGLLPMPPKNDLHPQIFGRIENKTYSIEKVLLETLPGYYLGGNLYRPTQPPPAGGFPADRLPARPLGLRAAGAHRSSPRSRRAASIWRSRATWSSPTTWWATTTPFRRRTISAARWNSSGISDRSPCSCGTPSARWISCSRCPAWIAARIGATGASGGGTQTFLLVGGGRSHTVLRAREYDLRHHAGRRTVRECAQPAPGHLQRGDRRHDGAAAHDHGLRHRRLDEEQRPPKSSPPFAPSTSSTTRPPTWKRAPGRAAQLQPDGSRGRLPFLRQARAR